MNFSPGLVSDLDSKSWLDLSPWCHRLAALEPNPITKTRLWISEIPQWDEHSFFWTFNPESSSYSGLQQILDSDEDTARRLSGNFLNGDEKAAR